MVAASSPRLIRWLLLTTVIVGIAVWARYREREHIPRMIPRYPIARVGEAIVADVGGIMKQSGVIFWNEKQYLASEFSRPTRKANLGGIYAGEWRLYGLTERVLFTSGNEFTVVVGLHSRSHSEVVRDFGGVFRVTPSGITRRLLVSAIAGTPFWENVIQGLATPKTLPDEPAPHVNADLALVRLPATVQEMKQYEGWLIALLGSRHRLVDGWGHRIKLTLDEKPKHSVLIASSAGPDGKWVTKDDMIVKRDTRTGKIVEERGFPLFRETLSRNGPIGADLPQNERSGSL